MLIYFIEKYVASVCILMQLQVSVRFFFYFGYEQHDVPSQIKRFCNCIKYFVIVVVSLLSLHPALHDERGKKKNSYMDFQSIYFAGDVIWYKINEYWFVTHVNFTHD